VTALSASVTRLLLAELTAEQLRHLAALKEADAPSFRIRRELSEEALTELADLLLAGETPTIGWWRRARRREMT
jgi:hypothetical protein